MHLSLRMPRTAHLPWGSPALPGGVEIYVALVGEGTKVWRPVEAEPVSGNLYRIVSANPDPDDERWQFGTGDVVRCEPREFSDGARGLVAVERISGTV